MDEWPIGLEMMENLISGACCGMADGAEWVWYLESKFTGARSLQS